MQDLILGNVGTMSNTIVTGLVTGDARTIVDPQWDVFWSILHPQPKPYPASILGVIPEIEVGDSGNDNHRVKTRRPPFEIILAEYGKVSPNAKLKCSIIAKNSARSGSAMSNGHFVCCWA